MTDTTEKFPPRVIVNQYGVKLTGDNPPDKEVLAAMMVWDTEYLSTQEHLSTVGKLTRENGKLRGMLVEAEDHIDTGACYNTGMYGPLGIRPGECTCGRCDGNRFREKLRAALEGQEA